MFVTILLENKNRVMFDVILFIYNDSYFSYAKKKDMKFYRKKKKIKN